MTMAQSTTVFEAVASHNLEGVAKEYLKAARTSILGYLTFQERCRPRNEEVKNEEKLDEYLQQVVNDPWRTPQDDEHYWELLRQITSLAHNESSSLLPSVDSTKCIGADGMMWQSMHALANSRPPPYFVCYNKQGMTEPPSGHDGPPIFDGSVANATPPPMGPMGPSGGSGTLLHLACVVDSPFALALALIGGADARSPHTAFRRLMIHEAACSGSIGCLRLLLELGDDCVHQLYRPHMLYASAADYTESSREKEMPFFPFDDELKQTSLASLIIRSPRQLDDRKRCARKQRPQWLDLMREVIDVSRKIKSGHLSELEGARLILSNQTLSRSTKEVLANSCSFLLKGNTIQGDPYNRSWYADGHGNTPLHWAAFKNERQCVRLLLQFHANPNIRAHTSGWTPLHDAAYSNSAESVELLLDAGADVDFPADSGATPLCFAAQEDADRSARMLLERGAELSMRCAGRPSRMGTPLLTGPLGGTQNGRFSGYTPLHYCAHYNAHRAARVLLAHDTAQTAMEIPDLNGRLPIHIAVARGSSDVLRELLHAGARIDMPFGHLVSSPARLRTADALAEPRYVAIRPQSPPRSPREDDATVPTPPVSSPILRSMIPAAPISSSKPWNCLTQGAIDECKKLISQAEQCWAPNRHTLFTPADRRAVLELLRVGKRFEQTGSGIFIDLWPLVLSFCGRGWFEVEGTAGDMSRALSLPAFTLSGDHHDEGDVDMIDDLGFALVH